MPSARPSRVDANAPDAGALVYTLGHETDHAVKVELDLLGLQGQSEGSYVQTALAAEASAQGNAFNVRDEVLAATGVDIGARAQMPQPLEQAYAQWDANNPEAYLRLAQTMGSMRTSTAPDQTYAQYYASRWNGAAPGTPHMPAPASAAASNAQKAAAKAAEWLDVKDLRTLRHVPGAEVPKLSQLATKAGSKTVLIALKDTRQPDGTPVIVATTQVRDDGTFAPPTAVRGSNVPKIVKRAVRGDNSAMRSARKDVDFYISPVSYERLQAFGGPSRINGDDGSHVLSPAADKIDAKVVADIQQLGHAKRYKSVKDATDAAKDSDIIYVIDRKGGAPKGYARRGTDGTWTYHVDAPMDGATVPGRSLEAAFARQQTHGARTLRSAPRSVRFVVSSMQPETVKELGGFLKPRTLWKQAEYGMPAFKPGRDCTGRHHIEPAGQRRLPAWARGAASAMAAAHAGGARHDRHAAGRLGSRLRRRAHAARVRRPCARLQRAEHRPPARPGEARLARSRHALHLRLRDGRPRGQARPPYAHGPPGAGRRYRQLAHVVCRLEQAGHAAQRHPGQGIGDRARQLWRGYPLPAHAPAARPVRGMAAQRQRSGDWRVPAGALQHHHGGAAARRAQAGQPDAASGRG
ncbi:hypothetical protein ACW9FF_00015 [Ralstonia mannitolilytica]